LLVVSHPANQSTSSYWEMQKRLVYRSVLVVWFIKLCNGGAGRPLFTILNLSCSWRTEIWLSNSFLITTISESVSGLENTLKWWREAAYCLNTSMVQITVRNNTKIRARYSFRGATLSNVPQQTIKTGNLRIT